MGNNLTNYSTKDIQSKLGITSDGIYGNQTTNAVKNWQAQNGLTADGIFGQKSLAKWNSLYGGGTAPQVGNTVDANQLGATQPFNIPPAQQGFDYNSLVASFNQPVQDAQSGFDTAQNTVNTNQSELINLSKMLEGQTGAQQNAENQVGIPQINKDLMELQNQARQKNLEYQQAFTNVEGQKVPLGVVVGQQAQLQRQQAIDIAIANSNIQAKQGQLSLAQDSVDRAIKAQFEPIYARIETQKMILQQNYENLSSAQKKLADAKQTQLDLQKKAIEEQQNVAEQINNLRIEAIKNGASNSTVNAMSKAKTLEEAIKSAGNSLTQQSKVTAQSSLSGNSLADVVMANPEIYNQLTPTKKGELAPILAARGFNAFGKPLSDTAITQINQTDFALSSLSELQSKIQNNLDYIGPIKGLQALNPWSKARQIQADVDRIRQTVGKALEGGVLRKEDEEKYKKILATVTDTPQTAVYKIQALISSIQGNLANYKALQSSTGRNVGGANNTEDLRTKYGY